MSAPNPHITIGHFYVMAISGIIYGNVRLQSLPRIAIADWPPAVMRGAARTLRRAFSSLPFRGELVELLVRERLPAEQAARIIDSVDSAVCEA